MMETSLYMRTINGSDTRKKHYSVKISRDSLFWDEICLDVQVCISPDSLTHLYPLT